MCDFRIEHRWSAPARGVAGADRATWAETEIYINDECVTSHTALVPGSSEGRAVVGSLAGVATWVALQWEHLLWEARAPFPKSASEIGDDACVLPGRRDASTAWQSFLHVRSEQTDLDALDAWQYRHTLGYRESNLALPSIVLVPEGDEFAIGVDDVDEALQPTVEFTAGRGQRAWPTLSWAGRDEVIGQLASLVDATLARASESVHGRRWAAWLQPIWAESRQAADNPAEQVRLLLGDRVAENWASVVRASHVPEPTLRDLVTDCRPLRDASDLTALADAAEQNWARPLTRRPRWSRFVATRSGDLPLHEQGYRLARQARSALGLPTQPLLRLDEAFEEFDARLALPTEQDWYRTAVIAGPGATAHVIGSDRDPRMSRDEGRRFAQAAALGRLLAHGQGSADTGFAAAHGDHARLLETRRANAFAAEFLLPSAAIVCSASANGGDDQGVICREYGISQSAARWHVYNSLRQS